MVFTTGIVAPQGGPGVTPIPARPGTATLLVSARLCLSPEWNCHAKKVKCRIKCKEHDFFFVEDFRTFLSSMLVWHCLLVWYSRCFILHWWWCSVKNATQFCFWTYIHTCISLNKCLTSKNLIHNLNPFLVCWGSVMSELYIKSALTLHNTSLWL